MRIRALLLALALLLLPRAASAFCGFYVGGAGAEMFNNATQVVLMRDGLRTVLTMQNNYQGPPQRFAMVVPVPVVLSKESVKTLPREIFSKVDTLDAPRLVEYWEQDPCRQFRGAQMDMMQSMPGVVTAEAYSAGSKRDLGVKVEAKFSVGEYDIVILSAKDSSGLETWLWVRHGRRARQGARRSRQPLLRQEYTHRQHPALPR